MKIVQNILCILFALIFINSGLNKLFNYMPTPELTAEQLELFNSFMNITWLMPLVAIVEVVGGILFAIPKTRALGAIVILPTMVGILLHHIFLAPEGLIISIVLMLINLWIIAINCNKYKALIG